ncbi:conserved hypothetical protein [Nitrosococcus halophilus Nc 4]|uniref:Uncharacterized protein n=1 Tax=Nitrosococcus halophilus (strain Nc4) TaxID=472759 RepID=D5BWG4_NITHN|nr:conserved hypothetical protein [Nitrosococcus halophilus Nc 4]
MVRSRFILTVLPLLLVAMGTSTGVEAQGLGTGNQTNSQSQDGQITVRTQSAGVSRIDYTKCVEFCADMFTGGADSPERNTCIAGCSRIDSSFQVDGILLGPSSED